MFNGYIHFFFTLIIYHDRLDRTFGKPNNYVFNHKNGHLLNPKECGTHNPSVPTNRVIGGSEAGLGEFPWIVHFALSSDDQPYDYKTNCGGALINDRTVLTAAHCVTAIPSINRIVVDFGEHDVRTDPDFRRGVIAPKRLRVKLQSICIHSEFDKSGVNENDIAIFRLAQKIKFTQYIRPYCIMHGQLLNRNLTGEIAMSAGWGVTTLGPSLSPILKKLHLRVAPQLDCTENYAYVPNAICAAGLYAASHCGGDSGGPLQWTDVQNGVSKTYLLGILSNGANHCRQKVSLYSAVNGFLPWILDNLVEDNNQCKPLSP